MAHLQESLIRLSATVIGTDGAVTVTGLDATRGYRLPTVTPGNTFYYAILTDGAGAWEFGYGTWTSAGNGTTTFGVFARTSVTVSNRGPGLPADFSGSPVGLIFDIPAERALFLDPTGSIVNGAAVANAINIPGFTALRNLAPPAVNNVVVFSAYGRTNNDGLGGYFRWVAGALDAADDIDVDIDVDVIAPAAGGGRWFRLLIALQPQEMVSDGNLPTGSIGRVSGDLKSRHPARGVSRIPELVNFVSGTFSTLAALKAQAPTVWRQGDLIELRGFDVEGDIPSIVGTWQASSTNTDALDVTFVRPDAISGSNPGRVQFPRSIRQPQPNISARTELTISGGSITPTRAAHSVDTEADAASDDLTSIVATHFKSGDILYLNAEHTARTVVLKASGGNIVTTNGADVILDDVLKTAVLRYDGAQWVVLEAGAARFTDAGAVADNAVIALAAGQRKTLLARSYTGVEGLADGEFASLIPPATGDVTFTHAGSPATGQAFDLDQDTNVVIPGGSSSAIIIQRVGSTIRIASGVGGRLESLLDQADAPTRDLLRQVVFGAVIGGAVNFAIDDDPLAVNYLGVTGAIATARPGLLALGASTDLGLNIIAKGTPGEALRIQDGAGTICIFAGDGSGEEQHSRLVVRSAKLLGAEPRLEVASTNANQGMRFLAKGASATSFAFTFSDSEGPLLAAVGTPGVTGNYLQITRGPGAEFGFGLQPVSGSSTPNGGYYWVTRGDGIFAIANANNRIGLLVNNPAAAVNGFVLSGSLPGTRVRISSSGTDVNVPMDITAQGTPGEAVRLNDGLGILAVFANDLSSQPQHSSFLFRAAGAVGASPIIDIKSSNDAQGMAFRAKGSSSSASAFSFFDAHGPMLSMIGASANTGNYLQITRGSSELLTVDLQPVSGSTPANGGYYLRTRGSSIFAVASANNNINFQVGTSATSANGLQVSPSAAGGPLSLFVIGSDANIPIDIIAKGAPTDAARIRDGSGNVAVIGRGFGVAAKAGAAISALPENQMIALEATSNTAGAVVYRGSDGVLRRAALTFA